MKSKLRVEVDPFLTRPRVYSCMNKDCPLYDREDRNCRMRDIRITPAGECAEYREIKRGSFGGE